MDFPNFEMLDAKFASALNKIFQNSHFKNKVSLEEQKAQKEDRFLRRRQIAVMVYHCFLVTGAHDTVLDYALFFSVTLRNHTVQEFDTRWDEISFQWRRFHQMIFWKVSTNWGYESLSNPWPYKNCTIWRFIRRFQCPIVRSWRRWWKGA